MSDAAAVIASLRSGHDILAGLVSGLSDEDLARPTGAAEWDVSQVLSHLGSGAEINQATLRAALDGKPNPGIDLARSVWARWDAAGRRERAEGFLRENAALVALYESLAPREDLRIDMGFLPAPVDLATVGRFRLSEFTLHSWDVRVGFDPGATLAVDATALIAPVVGQMAGMVGKPEALSGRQAAIAVTTNGPDSAIALRLGETISVGGDVPAQPDGTLSLPAEAWVRLVTGRLGPAYTPAGVTATGAADLDVLRAVFPGF
ncbi:MAG TPA: maleylpyruvate isomerase family mycothiol-dependent enzyme [Trebonia sp.]